VTGSLDGKVALVTPFGQITDADWDRLMGVNLRGVLVVTQRVLPSMLDRRRGRIINISSMAGKEGLPNLAHYCATRRCGTTRTPGS
jgi:NADP-dependent 3-hydroxy acid dehydrogenase YdfG